MHMFCTAAMETTSETCARKLVSPRRRKREMSLPSRRKLLRSSRMTFVCRRYQRESAAVSAWPMTVATAAPIMPQWKP